MSYTVVAILEAKKEKGELLKAALEEVAKLSLLEDANIEYRLHQSIDNENQFTLYEKWKSQELHHLQFEKPYIKELVGKLDGLLDKPYQVVVAQELELS